jgi:NAD+ kinase
MLKIMIVSKQDRENIIKAEEIGRYFDDVVYDVNTAKKLNAEMCDFKDFKDGVIITLGGDGTLLLAALDAKVPILPVKTGGVGFLCSLTYSDFLNHIDDLKQGNYQLKEVRRIGCNDYPSALNEVVITRLDPSKIFDLIVTIGGIEFEVRGDGLIISTMMGSTAYAHSAGGPIIHPSLDIINMVPVSPVSKRLGSLVLPIETKIKITPLKDGIITIDGHWVRNFKKEEEFIIREGNSLKLVSFNHELFYLKLKDFLKECC